MPIPSSLDKQLIQYLAKRFGVSADEVSYLADSTEKSLDRRMGYPNRRPQIFDIAVFSIVYASLCKSRGEFNAMQYAVEEMIAPYSPRK